MNEIPSATSSIEDKLRSTIAQHLSGLETILYTALAAMLIVAATASAAVLILVFVYSIVRLKAASGHPIVGSKQHKSTSGGDATDPHTS